MNQDVVQLQVPVHDILLVQSRASGYDLLEALYSELLGKVSMDI